MFVQSPVNAYQMFETRNKGHEAQICLTKKDLEDWFRQSKEGEEGGIVRHSTQCSKDIYQKLSVEPPTFFDKTYKIFKKRGSIAFH